MNKQDFDRVNPWARNNGDHPFAEMFFEFPVALSRAELWPFVTDTSRFNRALGLGKRFEKEKDGALHVRETFKGLKLEWVEEPWSWVHESHAVAERAYSRGPFRFFRAVFHLSDNPSGGVTMNIHFAWTLKYRALGWLLSLAEKGMGKQLRELFARFTGVVREREKVSNPYELSSPLTDPAALARLHQIGQLLALDPIDTEVRTKLIEFVKYGDALDLMRLRPLKLAREWKIDEQELLRACVFATKAGLLNLSWDVICPHCRGVRDESSALAGISAQGHCDVCDIDFSTKNENAVEISFHVHASIRDSEKAVFCSAEPNKKQHIKWQQRLAPGEKASALFQLSPGKYRLRETCGKHKILLNVLEKGSEHLTWSTHTSPEPEASLAERGAITVSNETSTPANLVLEELWWERDSLRPGRLFCVPEFQLFFSRDQLANGVQLDLGTQTIFFSDIVGSTQFYQEMGDSAAFAAVVDHFEALSAIIHRNEGAVIKTIGDSVMAAFHTPALCLKACEEAQLAFAPGQKKVRLRISVHYGQVIAVNWNTGKDFFGNVVNFTAKMQSCANAGEVAISDEVLAHGLLDGFVAAYTHRGAFISAGERSVKVRVFDLNPSTTKLKLSA